MICINYLTLERSVCCTSVNGKLLKPDWQNCEFVDLLATTVDDMTANHYISKAQSTCLMTQKENLDSDTCIIKTDFAENYQYVLEDEIQSFHWKNNQCNIQPGVIFYKNVLNVLQEKSFGFISEDLKYDTAFVY